MNESSKTTMSTPSKQKTKVRDKSPRQTTKWRGGEEKEKNCSLKSKTKRCFLYRSYCHYEYLLNSLIIKREPASNQGDPLPPRPSFSPSPPPPLLCAAQLVLHWCRHESCTPVTSVWGKIIGLKAVIVPVNIR